MTKKEQVERDADIIDKAMINYTGFDGAHFGFITLATGERHFFAGGRSDLSGFCLSEALANLVNMTQGLNEEFIDLVCETAKSMLNDMKSEGEIQ